MNNIAGSDLVQKWSLRDISRLLRRPRLQRAVGLEVILVDGVSASGTAGGSDFAAAGLHQFGAGGGGGSASIFFAFSNPDMRDEVYRVLLGALRARRAAVNGGGGSGASDSDAWFDDELGDPTPAGIAAKTRAWQSRSLSNLDYLLFLNSLAGRTRADLAAYPVLPWVVADYTSKTLDLSSPATFRDLAKPIGALNAQRLASFRNRFRDMPREPDSDPPFLYGTHYSTPGYCLYFLVRAMPEHMLRLQVSARPPPCTHPTTFRFLIAPPHFSNRRENLTRLTASFTTCQRHGRASRARIPTSRS